MNRKVALVLAACLVFVVTVAVTVGVAQRGSDVAWQNPTQESTLVSAPSSSANPTSPVAPSPPAPAPTPAPVATDLPAGQDSTCDALTSWRPAFAQALPRSWQVLCRNEVKYAAVGLTYPELKTSYIYRRQSYLELIHAMSHAWAHAEVATYWTGDDHRRWIALLKQRGMLADGYVGPYTGEPLEIWARSRSYCAGHYNPAHASETVVRDCAVIEAQANAVARQ